MMQRRSVSHDTLGKSLADVPFARAGFFAVATTVWAPRTQAEVASHLLNVTARFGYNFPHGHALVYVNGIRDTQRDFSALTDTKPYVSFRRRPTGAAHAGLTAAQLRNPLRPPPSSG